MLSFKPCDSCWTPSNWRVCCFKRTHCTQTALFLYLAQRNADFLIAIEHVRCKGFQLIRDRVTYGRRAPWQTSYREVKRGRDITWSLREKSAPEWLVEQLPGSATIISV